MTAASRRSTATLTLLASIVLLGGAHPARADQHDAYLTAWAETIAIPGRFIATGLRAGTGGLGGPYRTADIQALRAAAAAFAAGLERIERSRPPTGYATYHRELLPVYREMHAVMGQIIGAVRDPVALEVGWRHLLSLSEEAAELARLVASAPQRGTRPIAAAIIAVIALVGTVAAIVWGRRSRNAVKPVITGGSCARCRKPLPDDASFCPSCGAAAGRARARRTLAPAFLAGLLASIAATSTRAYIAEPELIVAAPADMRDAPISDSTGTTEPTTTATPTEPDPQGLVRYRVVNVRSVLNIRAEPKTGSRSLLTVQNGTVLTGPGRTQRDADGVVWASVYLPDSPQVGWASMRYLEVISTGGGD